jgi:hypothetical protein
MQIGKSIRRISRRAGAYLLLSLLISTGLPRCAYAQETRAREQQPASGKEASAVDGSALTTVASAADLAGENLPDEANEVGGDNKWPEGKKADSLANLRRQLAAVKESRFSPPAFTGDLRDISPYYVPSAPQSGSGKKVKKGPLVAGLIGLGLVGAGAYMVATYERPSTLIGLLDEPPTNRRSMGIAMMSLGATVAAIGFLSMR